MTVLLSNAFSSSSSLRSSRRMLRDHDDDPDEDDVWSPPTTSSPSHRPSFTPSDIPSSDPSWSPSSRPSGFPSIFPWLKPSPQPSLQPSLKHSNMPSLKASNEPTSSLSSMPSQHSSSYPSNKPTAQPSSEKSTKPSMQPSLMGSDSPSSFPTTSPTPCKLDECGVCNGLGKITCCDGTKMCDSAECPQNKPASICFALDESGSVCSVGASSNCENLKNNVGRPDSSCDYMNNCPKFNVATKTFTKAIIDRIDGITETKFAIVTFARNSDKDASLSFADSAKKTIDALEYSGGMTNTQAAIEDCKIELQRAPDDHIKYIIMLTDGYPTNNRSNRPFGTPCGSCQQQARQEATLAKNLGITLITVGIESVAFDPDFLEELSSPGLNFMVDDFEKLETIEENVSSAANICLDSSKVSPQLDPYWN